MRKVRRAQNLIPKYLNRADSGKEKEREGKGNVGKGTCKISGITKCIKICEERKQRQQSGKRKSGIIGIFQ